VTQPGRAGQGRLGRQPASCGRIKSGECSRPGRPVGGDREVASLFDHLHPSLRPFVLFSLSPYGLRVPRSVHTSAQRVPVSSRYGHEPDSRAEVKHEKGSNRKKGQRDRELERQAFAHRLRRRSTPAHDRALRLCLSLLLERACPARRAFAMFGCVLIGPLLMEGDASVSWATIV
jgi:hypothetical protein